ncbi:hypothetical protein BOTBODRAFT_141203 [Botryobasidium botryosum FD-172 SS1]|uniref:Amine oxidase n=1 Tax=Botryobasidium botryosum (strain FD-172 SS1) TaxID=930990 RepID=A0A067LVE5_BOTB1|nr:hypothetical protein BOTBODRAFT_141203 [Botryobasidium botryosum FD-172 SS1]
MTISSTRKPCASVIVVGGGISGLAAARHIAMEGYKVIVIEARDRLGGRVHTHKYDTDGNMVDLGASFVHGVVGNPLVKIAKKLDMRLRTLHPVRRAIDHNGRALDDDLQDKIAKNVLQAFFYDTPKRAQASDKIPSSDIPLSQPMFEPSSSLFAGLKDPLEAFYARAVMKEFDGWTGAALEDVSFRWWGFDRETDGPDAFVSSGYGKIIDWLEAEILEHGGEIHLNEEVLNVEAVGALGIEASHTIVTTARATYEAPYTLVTIPLGVLKSKPELFSPPLPPRRQAAISRLGFGLLNKVILKYEEAWWPRCDEYLFLPDPANPGGLTLPRGGTGDKAVFVLDLWALTGTPALLLFVGADDGEVLETFGDEEIKTWAEGLVVQYLMPQKGIEVPPASSVIVTRWKSDPYALGSYSYIPKARPGEEACTPLDMVELSMPVWDRIFFAGEHTEREWFASVHGAWASGQREGQKLIGLLGGMNED